MRPVDAVIVGAQKAGTSSLLRYLDQHPSIAAHRRAEFSYFVDEADYAAGYDESWQRYFFQSGNNEQASSREERHGDDR